MNTEHRSLNRRWVKDKPYNQELRYFRQTKEKPEKATVLGAPQKSKKKTIDMEEKGAPIFLEIWDTINMAGASSEEHPEEDSSIEEEETRGAQKKSSETFWTQTGLWARLAVFAPKPPSWACFGAM
ncbi:hypothetical protein NDU88_001143 [Pleurodeles waltl]|uniref:Uncharacterized protein n=1 Tax=Pleurodeles waltl TaxID=8319 RepID=A0AAV7UVB8_PLEWA|nr:hypothetical protein NDU88_001143 [Pleurodeles waltl]